MDKKTKRIDARKEHARRQSGKQVVRKRVTHTPEPTTEKEKEMDEEIDQDGRDLNADEQQKIVNNAEENAQHNSGLRDEAEK